MPEYTPIRPLLSRMSMADLERLDDFTLARIGLWRKGRPKPALRKRTEQWHRSIQVFHNNAQRRRRLLRA